MFSQMSSLRCAFFHHCRQQWPRMRGHLSVQKRIKSYFRSTMVQERLNGLAILNINSDKAKLLDFSGVIDEFAQRKARKAFLNATK